MTAFLVSPDIRSRLVRMMTGLDIRPQDTADPIVRAVRLAMLDAVSRPHKPLDTPETKPLSNP